MTPDNGVRHSRSVAIVACAAICLAPAHASPVHASPRAHSISSACDSDQRNIAPNFSASSLREGRFVYREIVAQKDTSTFTLELRRRADGTWRFTGDGSGQHWEAITDSAFHPRSASLSMLRRGRPFGFQLRYAGDSVFATQASGDSAMRAPEIRASAELRGTTIDQRIDWASLMASDLAVGKTVAYEVYDPATGSSRLTASATDGPTLPSPDGPRATIALAYTICKAGERESYTVYATRNSPRMMLREDMRGNVVSELVRIER